MSSLAPSTAPGPQSSARRHTYHTFHASTHASSPPAASPALVTSYEVSRDDYMDFDEQAMPTSALLHPKSEASVVPFSTKCLPSHGGTAINSPSDDKNVSTAKVVTPAVDSDAGSGTATAVVSAALPQQQPQCRITDGYTCNLGTPPAATEIMEAVVLNKGKMCTLAYSPSRGTFRIKRALSGGRTRTVLNIPVRFIINIETAFERDARQRARQANDDTIKHVFSENGRGAGSVLCAFPSGAGEDTEALVFAHSRVNTASSSVGFQSGFPVTRTPSQSCMCTAVSPAAATAPSIHYYVHYVRQRNRYHPSIHTLEFQSSGPAETVQCIVSKVVQRIYQKGSKHIIAFISAKSGKGKGEYIFEKQVLPLLHFSRHTYQAYSTRRAHDCEDYVASLENSMSSNTVIVVVGGDGMIHEAVNGLHRRKVALLRWLRSVTGEVNTGDASFASPSASLHLNDDGSCAGADVQLPPALHEGPGTTVSTYSGSVSKPARHCEACACSYPTFLLSGREENKCHRHGGNGVASSEETVARETHRLACCLVQDGWDALMPLIATVATGSACGLAKSLDVLSVAEAALSLVHLNTVHMDLLMMNFTPNEDMLEYHRGRMSTKRLDAANRKFSQYKEDKAAELQERLRLEEAEQLPPGTVAAGDPTSPFLRDGSSVYRDAVSCAAQMPELHSRIAFMSLSFGVANDIDHGSETFRWMGNARFHVYGGYVILRGLKGYKGMLRYLPWESKAGKTVEKLHTHSKMPSAEEFPLCTMREGCPHCRQYTFAHCDGSSLSSSMQGKQTQPGPIPNTSRSDGRATSAAATLAPYTDRELLDEDIVDFDDDQLPWVTIRGEFCMVLMCNVPNVAQDMLMAPLVHMSDGAIDVVYCRIDPGARRGGRMEMLKFFMGLASGSHVNLEFVNYVKARALDIKVDGGISMSDGELMPLSSVRVTKMRGSVQLVRSE
ncbi:hypothetical protein GH5_05067 [Leishmania sp. Ghana 2012 LV757]|uniref:hypothetical protein n=1 Tax=Leishmania sp. Ghana 2012 LV757 TaxID=2803181 RepID=UPI001B606C3C|nr:hypothetical protein GH5_05067 [Leishmania sp. Ghana 2012 LV757]